MTHKEWGGFCPQSFESSEWCICRDDAAVMLVHGVKCKMQNLRRGIRRLRRFVCQVTWANGLQEKWRKEVEDLVEHAGEGNESHVAAVRKIRETVAEL
eukprot:725161-Pleurochrysis_carterae.AAC.1